MKTVTQTTVQEVPQLVITPDIDPMSPLEWGNGEIFGVDTRSLSIDTDNAPKNITLQEVLDLIDKGYIVSLGDYGEHSNIWLRNYKEITKKSIIDEITKWSKDDSLCYKEEGMSIADILGDTTLSELADGGESIFYAYPRGELTLKQARKGMKAFWKEMDAYIRGDIFSFVLYGKDGEVADSCTGFYDIEDIKEHLPKEWADVDLSEYVQY